MSILIKNMSMPKNCMDCPMNYDSIDCVLRNNISLRNKTLEFMYENNRHPDCPLVELPPHGRLIDADALHIQLIDKELDQLQPWISFDDYREVVQIIDDAPTTIESEETDMDSFIRIFEEDDEEDGMDSFIRILKD